MIPFEFSVCIYGVGVLVKVDATIGKLAERSLLLDLGGLDGVLVRDQLRSNWGVWRFRRWVGDGRFDTHVFVSHVCGD